MNVSPSTGKCGRLERESEVLMKLLITSRIPQEIFDDLAKVYTIDYHDSLEPLSPEEIKMRIQDVDALLCPLSDKIDREILDAGENLKLVANYGAGFDNIDTKYAAYKNIAVSNAPAPSSAVSTAEMTFSLLLAAARGLIPGDKLVRQGDFQGWRPTFFLGHQVKGKVLGIIGLGHIGSELAKRALAFGMEVVYFSRTRKSDLEDLGLKYLDLAQVLQKSDFVSLHLSYQPQLHHLISKDALELMKESAILINASRGPIVDEKALVQALKDKKIAGAALDVYEFEPKVHPDLLTMDQVVLSPHLGNATYAARMEMGENARDNLLALAQGKDLPNRVN